MTEFNLSYREVTADQYSSETWKEISLNTGGTQSTLQDIKVTEKANGYCYKDSSKFHTRNRFIYWRINHDVLEVVEQSLDVNLSGNRVKYKFVDTPILDGVSAHETYNNVIILVPTVCSVHRLIFPHPDRLHKQDELIGSHPDLSFPSIFADAMVTQARDPTTFHVFCNPTTTNSQLPHLAASCLTLSEEALFLLSYPSGELLLVRQQENGASSSHELKYTSIMPRFLSDITEKFRSKSKDGDVGVSLLLHTIGLETYALMLCRDGHLRVWSCSKYQCIAVNNILTETGDSNRHFIQGAQNHILRKSISSNEGDSLLGIFLSFSSECQFHILKPVMNGNQFRMSHLVTLHSPEKDLVDFCFTPTRIWSVWRGEDGECSVYSAILSSSGVEGTHWIPVILESMPDSNQEPKGLGDIDPRQAYLEHIFHPGRFPLHIISKALSIYKKSTLMSDLNLSVNVLKQHVCMAVENEIQNDLKENEVSDEDYLDCALWCWQRFYSCCVQYHITGLRPIGLLLLPSVSGALLLKKSTYSFLRPLDVLEHMMLCIENTNHYQFIDHPLLSEDLDVAEDVIHLIEVIIYLDQQVNENFMNIFEQKLSQLNAPDIIMSELIEKIQTEMDYEFAECVSHMLKKCRLLYQAMHKLLEMLRIDNMIASGESVENSSEYVISVSHLLSSQLGIILVSHSLHQQAQIRFAICRNLLLAQCILLERQEIDWNLLEAIRSICTLETVVLTQASYAMLWICDLPVLPSLPLESTMQRLASLKLSPVFNLHVNSLQSISLLEFFAGSTGGDQAHKSLLKLQLDEENLAHWHLSLLPYVLQLAQLIWPISSSHILSEWLLSSGQHVWLQQYVRLLGNWCEWNSCTRNFLLGAALLNSGESDKAQNLFLTAAKGIFTDKFLSSRMLVSDDIQSRSSVNYYLKVIHLFELHNAWDCAIYLANVALSIADENDPHIATLFSIKFKHHLALKHYEKAYNSLYSNPDDERKKDNLRDLVKRLLDEKKLDKLLSFNYFGLEDHFINILYTRARATDSVKNIYYDFLYSYQIKRGPAFMRAAAAAMYEQGFRLSSYNTIQALDKQIKCYLAAKNALTLCTKEFSWITRPTNPDMEDVTIIVPTSNSAEEGQTKTFKQQVEVVDIDELEQEIVFASARLQLARFDQKTLASNITDPMELVMLLTNMGLFKLAIEICKTFQITYEPVFEGLTRICVILTKQCRTETAWRWLIENDIQDVTITSKDASNVAWKMLQCYLEMYEEDNMSILHKAVCAKLLNLGRQIPQWILDSYKKRNPAELLRLFYFNGRLRVAAELARDYILAAFGHGKEHFGIKYPLSAVSPPLCLPLNTIELILNQLKAQNTANPEKPLEREYEDLSELYDKYLQDVYNLTNDNIKIQLDNYRKIAIMS